MAHPCFSCGSECCCHGDIDDVIVSKTPRDCDGCGCDEFSDEDEDYLDDDDDEYEFSPCSQCDGHPACEDHGCAYELGLGKLVKKECP